MARLNVVSCCLLFCSILIGCQTSGGLRALPFPFPDQPSRGLDTVFEPREDIEDQLIDSIFKKLDQATATGGAQQDERYGNAPTSSPPRLDTASKEQLETLKQEGYSVTAAQFAETREAVVQTYREEKGAGAVPDDNTIASITAEVIRRKLSG